ncbi:MAG: hypothetical protein EON54_14785 [Alcaligenaceae bacterium]|jgi:hypothetical protein|nr:MAG: hypothetical protein EON54_14785 [Alcaligenaceae bacterium]
MKDKSIPTDISWRYRKRAANLSHTADSTLGHEKQIELVKEALYWIQLAENEEFMAVHRPMANDN